MTIRKILIYGSSHLAQETCLVLRDYYTLVGHIPSTNPTIPGSMGLPIADETASHDIKLSIQYDKKVPDISNTYNVHTGLLPKWGGTDILYHTLKGQNESYLFEQGLTFHKMSSKFDYGNIISKMTYPIFEYDTMLDLYERVVKCFPNFVVSSLQLLESLSEKDILECYRETPRIFKRGNIEEEDIPLYKETLINLRSRYCNEKR